MGLTGDDALERGIWDVCEGACEVLVGFLWAGRPVGPGAGGLTP